MGRTPLCGAGEAQKESVCQEVNRAGGDDQGRDCAGKSNHADAVGGKKLAKKFGGKENQVAERKNGQAGAGDACTQCRGMGVEVFVKGLPDAGMGGEPAESGGGDAEEQGK